MRAARTSSDRVTQFHAGNLTFDGRVALERRILHFVKGVRGQRTKPVTEAQIIKWFAATDPEFTRAALKAVYDSGKIYNAGTGPTIKYAAYSEVE